MSDKATVNIENATVYSNDSSDDENTFYQRKCCVDLAVEHLTATQRIMVSHPEHIIAVAKKFEEYLRG